MDEKSQAELQRILSLDPETLTSDEVGFLHARASYLTSENKRVFAQYFETKQDKEKPSTTEEVKVAPKKK